MLSNVGLNSDNVFKFATTLSLIASIYFLSLYPYLLTPYNKQVAEENIERARLTAKLGYYEGLSRDLAPVGLDTVKDRTISYHYLIENDSSDAVRYYSNTLLGESNKNQIDSLNVVNREKGEIVFKLRAMRNHHKSFESNMNSIRVVSTIFGFLFLGAFLYSFYRWTKFEKVNILKS